MTKLLLLLLQLLFLLGISHTVSSSSELPNSGMYPDATNCFKELPRDVSTTQKWYYDDCKTVKNLNENSLAYKTCVLVNRRIISRELNDIKNTQGGYNYTVVSCAIHQQVAGDILGIPFDEIIANRNQPEFKRVEEILGKCSGFSFIVPVVDLMYEKQVEENEEKFSKLVGCIEDALKC